MCGHTSEKKSGHTCWQECRGQHQTLSSMLSKVLNFISCQSKFCGHTSEKKTTRMAADSRLKQAPAANLTTASVRHNAQFATHVACSMVP